MKEKSNYESRKSAVDAFNAEHKWKKRGIELQPIRYCFTHAFATGTTVLVNINATDGSVTAYHNGAEIGQGLNAKLRNSIAACLEIPPDTIVVRECNTSVTPNAAITGGSVMSEAVVGAATDACNQLLERLAPVREFMTETDGPSLDPNPMMSAGQFAALQANPAGVAPTWGQLCTFSSGSFMPFDLHINLSATGQFNVAGRNNLDFIKAPMTDTPTSFGFKVIHQG